MLARARAISVAPTMTSRGRTGNASMNSDRPPSSTVRDSAAPERLAGRGRQLVVERWVAERAVEPVVVERQRRLRRRAVARSGARRTRAGGASAGSGVMTAMPWPPAWQLAAPPRAPRRGSRGCDEDVDRAAAGEPDVPRLLVADPVANHAGVPGLAAPARSPPPRRPRRSRR